MVDLEDKWFILWGSQVGHCQGGVSRLVIAAGWPVSSQRGQPGSGTPDWAHLSVVAGGSRAIVRLPGKKAFPCRFLQGLPTLRPSEAMVINRAGQWVDVVHGSS